MPAGGLLLVLAQYARYVNWRGPPRWYTSLLAGELPFVPDRKVPPIWPSALWCDLKCSLPDWLRPPPPVELIYRPLRGIPISEENLRKPKEKHAFSEEAELSLGEAPLSHSF